LAASKAETHKGLKPVLLLDAFIAVARDLASAGSFKRIGTMIFSKHEHRSLLQRRHGKPSFLKRYMDRFSPNAIPRHGPSAW
jgi:hypothetical protein